ncbi:hypothetical protein [Paenibacillus sp. FSL R7-0337]|uniref:hypothetical protein n=1 Tax=Paenibacillus sp. FSL R7-0337 TaxID=1926588 RepID=UPI00096F9276|nr:hypothetical protein [Paenibacillus sp. FSL R7-0337]OMF99372.1 hypothetical protein BK147_07310 [Paenibacillus sp. FSL R7-0337]
MRMARVCLLWIGACLLLGIAGCASGKEIPEYTDVHNMTGLDGSLNSRDSLTSPVLRDVYDRSIPEEVYDTP